MRRGALSPFVILPIASFVHGLVGGVAGHRTVFGVVPLDAATEAVVGVAFTLAFGRLECVEVIALSGVRPTHASGWVLCLLFNNRPTRHNDGRDVGDPHGSLRSLTSWNNLTGVVEVVAVLDGAADVYVRILNQFAVHHCG